MKNLLLLLAISIFSLLGSCCNADRGCIFYNKEIYFVGFFKNEIDTVQLVVTEQKGSAYGIIDSFIIFKNSYSYSQDSINFSMYLPKEINKKYTYTFKLKNLGLQYVIDGFATKRKACDGCFGIESDWTDYIGGYNLNGVYQDQEKITIYK